MPAPSAMAAAPTWCEANTQPKTTGAAAPNELAAQRHRRRDRGDPVEPVEHDERDHAGLDVRPEQRRQREQRQPAQHVVGEQQVARVDAVGEPAGRDGAGHVEDPDEGEQARGHRLRHAVVVRGRDEVRLDQAHRGGAADQHSAGEVPEPLRPGGRRQRPHGQAGGAGCAPGRRRRPRCRRRAARRGRGAGRAAATSRAGDGQCRHRDRQRRRPPPVAVGRAGTPAGGTPARPAAPPAVSTPETRPRRATNQRPVTVATSARAIEPGAEPDEHAPAQHELPARRHEHGEPAARPRRRAAPP